MNQINTLYTYLLSQSDYGESFALDGLLLVASPPGVYMEVAGDALTQAEEAGLIRVDPKTTKLGWSTTPLGDKLYRHHQQLEKQQTLNHPAVR